jgi:predicted transcriptional regulator of viral defense system
VNAGNWIREHRGIYRLAEFPALERPDLMLWYLWSQNRQEVSQGTYSHDTALSLRELSEVMPSKLHMTVPKAFRRNSKIPEILILHHAQLDKSDVQEMHGVRVTRPLRTIVSPKTMAWYTTLPLPDERVGGAIQNSTDKNTN